MPEIGIEDLRAAVSAGVVTEAQATRLTTLAEMRAGYRGAMAADDEPFELFRGFNEIFVALGVGLLGLGLWAMAALLAPGVTAPGVAVALACWLLAEYFTRRRRMVLPSLMLALGFVAAIGAAAAGQAVVRFVEATPPGAFAERLASGDGVSLYGAAVALAAAAAALLFYLRFRLPFAIFLLGLALFAALTTGTGLLHPERWAFGEDGGVAALVDLGAGGGAAWATLGFGLAAFAVAMAYDMQDPHRLSRLSACGFWLHVIAAPAIVNTAALTLWTRGGALGAALTLATIALLAFVALVIDRRSFLIASVAYLALLLGSLFEGLGGGLSRAAAILALGVVLTALGAFWTAARGAVMAALPDFPGKDRLPPYAEPA
jgi:hypothetical protein